MIRDRWFRGRKTRSFTLQWHLTNACPFHCRHCYDRSARGELNLAAARAVLADFRDFCRRERVEPRISLSGGDPLAYRDFWPLYADIAAAGIQVSLLGNPISKQIIHRLLSLWKPVYYQVSLEGLREHNDAIRGQGHFDQVRQFLADARSLGLETHVMLTLTRANRDQVLPLGELLRGWTARFTFNRLAQVGEGADLEVPAPLEYAAFLRDYLAARRHNPVFGFKDNLFNPIRRQAGRPLFGGCTGFGCGAAFNFVAVLPEGEVHACRKYPSLIGHLRQNTLSEIYHSAPARRYRLGSTACSKCRVRNACGGCPAVTFGQGLDPLKDRDPFCDYPEQSS